jgi:DNA-binding CsgD family transcriptional regulator
MAVGSSQAEASLRAGAAALARAAWGEARTQFTAALADGDSLPALLGLGIAARAQLDSEVTLDAHERGFRLARADGDEQAAARFALELVFDCLIFRGPAEAGGWLERGARLLDGVPAAMEHVMLAYLRARSTLFAGHDPAAARALAAAGAETAREAGWIDGELGCRALEGLALVAGGSVPEGMRLLDEAATGALAGEISDPQIVGSVCCHLIDACQRVRDFDRAGEWCRRVDEMAARFGDASLFAACRTQYGEVLVWQGAWSAAERTLVGLCRDRAAARLKAVEGIVRLAELRRRQGRLDDAAALLEEVDGQRTAAVVGAALALDRGRARQAADEAERCVRRIGDGDRFARVPALELVVRAQVALGHADDAEWAVAELEAVAAATPTNPLRAAALIARGRVEAGRAPERARTLLEDAADLYRESGIRYEASQARRELACVLRAIGLHDAAAESDAAATAELARLGAAAAEPTARVRDRDALTTREREVLRLLAEGRSNDEIARRLVLSVRTVESHVASAYRKIGVGGRTARAAATAHVLRHGLH